MESVADWYDGQLILPGLGVPAFDNPHYAAAYAFEDISRRASAFLKRWSREPADG